MMRHEKTGLQAVLFAVCATLVILVWTAFGNSLSFEFVNYDDGPYVYANEQISNGVTLDGLKWIASNPHSSNWHPLTSFSHLLDCQIYGLNPFGHHLGNLILHALCAVFLFVALRRMTGSLWCSALVAALFAVHPLRVESVVWISERKDVLCGLFFALTLWAYAGYARRPFLMSRYLLVLLFFVLGLLSKPMIVTLPFVLLLLDFWPLQRTGLRRVLLEKIPLLICGAAFCAVTIWAQHKAIAPTDFLPLPWRTGNAFLSYITYIRQLFLPLNLAALYPVQAVDLSPVKVAASVLLISGVTVLCLWQWKKRPWLVVGWLLYLGMLVPVIGILQVGSQAHADRYTYLPQIGLLIMIVWSCAKAVNSRRRQLAAILISAIVLLGLVTTSRRQADHWRNSVALWTHTLRCTGDNPFAHANLGAALLVENQPLRAVSHLSQSIQLEPRQPEVHNNLAVAYAELGRYADAAAALKTAIALAEGRVAPGVLKSMHIRLVQYEREAQCGPDGAP